MNEKIIQKNKTIKIFIYFVFALLCFLVFTTNGKAWTASDVVTIKPIENWADVLGVNFQLNDDSYYDNEISNGHLSIMQNIISNDLTTYQADYYIIQSMQYNEYQKNVQYKITYFNSLSGFNSISSNVFAFSSYVQYRASVSTGGVGNRIVIFNGATNIESSSYSTSNTWNVAGNFNILPGTLSSEPNVVYIPRRFFIDTNIPKSILDIIQLKTDSYSGYPLIKFFSYNTIARNTSFLLSDFIDFSLVVDEEPPVLDFIGIEQPQWLWKGDTYTVPMPYAYDNIDGDITNNINVTTDLNPNIVGNYQIIYEVCDSSDNCTSYNMPVEVRETIKIIDMTGKSAILFWYKDFSKVLSPNSYCDSIEMTGSCFVQSFDYLGRWKYSKVNLNDLDTLLYENGGIYAPLDPSATDYKNYEHINLGHLTSDFQIGNEYAVLMYNESGPNIVKIKYNQKYFDYKIYNSLNDTDEKEIPYIDVNGNNQNTSDIQPPFTDLEDPATVTNPTTAGLFGSFTTNTYGLTAIISAPLNLINQLTSKTCTAVNLPLPYLNNKYLILPCINTMYDDYFGSFFDLYQLITFGIVAYWVIVRLLNMVKDFKNPDHDEIEVLDL